MMISEQVGQVIKKVLDKIRRDFYADRVREFKRDYRALMKAVSTYGHECNQRNWQFEADFICQEIKKLLLDIRTKGADIGYLPLYLEGAIRRHIGQRAEELNAKAKLSLTHANNLVKLLRSKQTDHGNAARHPSAVEVFAQVFNGIKNIEKQRRRENKPAKEKQTELL